MGIEATANKFLHSTPTDQQRLCLLARALVKNPPLLILDEPCQGLNQQQKESFRQLIGFICAHSSTSIIYVTHYPCEIPACVGKAIKLKEGKMMSVEHINSPIHS